MVVSLAVTNDYYVYPHNSSQFPLGPGEATSNLLANITALFRLHLIILFLIINCYTLYINVQCWSLVCQRVR